MQHRFWASVFALSLCAVSVECLAGGVEKKTHHVQGSRLVAVDTVKISGHLQVFLRSTKHGGHVLVAGSGASQVIQSVQGNVLTLTAPAYHGPGYPIHAVIYLPKPLHRLVEAGSASVVGRHLSTSQLTLSMKGMSSLDLQGRLNINTVELFDASRLHLDGITGSHLEMRESGVSTAYLAGNVGYFACKLRQEATLHGQYLNAKTVFVSTVGNSMAYVAPQNNLRAFAGARANVYYFTRPTHKTRISGQHGNVLYIATSKAPWKSGLPH